MFGLSLFAGCRERIQLLEAQAALAEEDFDRAESILNNEIVIEDLREGEVSLSRLWIDLHVGRLSRNENLPVDDALVARVEREFPIPSHLDFRMST